MQTIDKKIDCIRSRQTCIYWKKGRKKKNLGTSVTNNRSESNILTRLMFYSTARRRETIYEKVKALHNCD